MDISIAYVAESIPRDCGRGCESTGRGATSRRGPARERRQIVVPSRQLMRPDNEVVRLDNGEQPPGRELSCGSGLSLMAGTDWPSSRPILTGATGRPTWRNRNAS